MIKSSARRVYTSNLDGFQVGLRDRYFLYCRPTRLRHANRAGHIKAVLANVRVDQAVRLADEIVMRLQRPHQLDPARLPGGSGCIGHPTGTGLDGSIWNEPLIAGAIPP